MADVRKGSEREGLYDTSKCNVKFRRPRILQSRSLSFDHRRKLGFEPNRRIKARLSGVVFRRKAAIGFRNVGISNLEEVMDRDDWPEVGKAQLPDTLRLERRKDWSRTWGQDKGYREKWGTSPIVKREVQVETGEAEDDEVFRASPEKRREPASIVTIEEQPAGPASRVSPVMRRKALAFNEYALQLMESGEYVRAQSYFRKAIELDPDETVYVTNLERCQKWMDYYRRGGRSV